MSVLAIDLGNCNVVASVPKDRGIDIILSDTSKREIPTVVSYGQEERFFADQANGEKLSNRNGCFYYIPLILGEKTDSQAIARARTMGARFQLKTGTDGRALGSVKYGGDIKTVETQYMAAALIHRVHGFAKATENVNPTDIILAVPGNWGTEKRQLLRAAAQSTELHCLGIVSQHIAVGAGYYMKRIQDFQKLADDNEGIKEAFLSIGECQSFFAILEMSKNSVETISAVYNSEFGSIDFDLCLKSLIEDQLKAKGKLSDDEIESAKTQEKIMNAANSIKKSLCMNQSAQATIECVGDAGIDVGLTVRLDDFNELIKGRGLLEKLEKLIRDGLKDIDASEIESIEVLGGASRIRALEEIVYEIFGADKQSKRLNPDEAVAYGLGWLGAMRSTKYHIPFKVSFHDMIRPLAGPIKLLFRDATGAPVHDEYTMYDTGASCPKSKKLALSFEPGKYNFILSEGDIIHEEIEVDVKPKDLSQFKDREAAERDGVNFAETAVKLHIKVDLDADQYISFTSISREEHQLIHEDQRKEVPNDKYDEQVAARTAQIAKNNEDFEKAMSEFESKDAEYKAAKAEWDEQKNQFEAAEENKGKKFEKAAPVEPIRPTAPKVPDDVPKNIWITEKVPKIVISKTDIKYNVLENVNNIEQLMRDVKAFEKECAKIDSIKEEYAEAYNKLETLLYKTKDDVEMGLKDYLTDGDVHVVKGITQEIADFLDQIEGPQQIDQLNVKTKDVAKHLEPFYARKQSHTDAEYQYTQLKRDTKALLKRYSDRREIPAVGELLGGLEKQIDECYDKLNALNKLEIVKDVFTEEIKKLAEIEGQIKKAVADAGAKSENVTPKGAESSSGAPPANPDQATT